MMKQPLKLIGMNSFNRRRIRMANHEIQEPNQFSDEIRKLKTSHPAHADTFNPLFEKLVNNDVFLKSLTERLIQEHTHSGENGEGSKISLDNIDVPAALGNILTEKELAEHSNERNPHGTRYSDVGAASEQDLTTHSAEKASTTKLGHIMVGAGLSITADGKLSAKVQASPIPSGLISMWSGAINTIPSDWVLCDGANDTPNLTDRFIVGAGGKYSIGDTGGADSVTLTTAQLPSHGHGSGTLSAASAGSHSHGSGTLATNTTGSHNHTVTDYYFSTTSSFILAGGSDYSSAVTTRTTSSEGSHSHSIIGSTASGGAHTHTITGSTATAGSGQSHENRPPYYALAYIMKL